MASFFLPLGLVEEQSLTRFLLRFVQLKTVLLQYSFSKNRVLAILS